MATYYWVGGSGTWDGTTTTNWAALSGGAGGAGVPGSADTVWFDANSGTAATVSVASTAICSSCRINKSDIILSLTDNVSINSTNGNVIFTTGTITLNNYTLTAVQIDGSAAGTKTINFGTGQINISGGGIAAFIPWQFPDLTNVTYTGTPVVNFTYSGSANTRTIRNGDTGGGSAAKAITVNVTAGSDGFGGYNPVHINNFNFTGFSGTLGSAAWTVYGNLTLSTGMTTGATQIMTFAGSGTQTITSNGKTYDGPITVNGTGNTVTLADNLVMGSTRALRLTNGTFDAANKNVTIGTFALSAGTKTLTMGSGTWTVAGATWNANTNSTGLTVSASTATISMTSGSAKTFSGGGFVWPTLNQGGSGALTIAQSNTFANITNTVQPATITLTAGTTQTVSAFSIAGSAGNLITLNTTVAGSRATLSDSSGTISLSYVSIQDIVATGGAVWRAYTSNGNVDAGNNLGWDFNFDSNVYTRRKAKVVYRR